MKFVTPISSTASFAPDAMTLSRQAARGRETTVRRERRKSNDTFEASRSSRSRRQSSAASSRHERQMYHLSLGVDSSDPALNLVPFFDSFRLPCVSCVEPGLRIVVAVVASPIVIDVPVPRADVRPTVSRNFPKPASSASSSRPNISTRSPGARAHTEPRAWTLPPSPRPPKCPSRCFASPRSLRARRPPPDAIRRAIRFVPRHACRPLASTGKRTTRRDEALSTWRPRRSRRTRASTT